MSTRVEESNTSIKELNKLPESATRHFQDDTSPATTTKH